MSIDANDLILFARVAALGSFTQAARALDLPKSTVSRRISALEVALGERILQRSTRRLTITRFGEQILEPAKRLAEDAAVAAEVVLNRSGLPRGVLRVSMPPDFTALDLTTPLLRFAQRYPAVRLELDLSPRRVDLVAERYDLAIRIADRLPDDSQLVARQLCQFSHALYASAAYLARRGTPAQPADLLAHTGLHLTRGDGEVTPWRLARGSEVWEGRAPGPLLCNSPALQRSLALEGMGIVGLPALLIGPRGGTGDLRRVLPEWTLPTLTVWCVTPGRKLLPARTTAFIEILKQALPG